MGRTPRGAVVASVVLAFALPAYFGARNLAGSDRGASTLARDWAVRALQALPEGSLLFATGYVWLRYL